MKIRMKKNLKSAILPMTTTVILASLFAFQTLDFKTLYTNSENGISVPKGFTADIIATDLGKTRQLVIADNGLIYINRSKLVDDKSILLLKLNKEGKVESKQAFGNLPGTGIEIKNGYLYTSSNTSIFRYKLNAAQEVIDQNNPELLVSGMADHGRDNAKPFAIDNKDNLYVTIGSWNDPCREAGSGKGIMPCSILDSAGGIWQFSATKLNQTFGDGQRYATGLKNSVAMNWNFMTNSLFTVVHGRGQFHDYYSQFYTPKQSGELPAEAMYELHKGDDAGWPYIYYDQFQKKKMLAPEYGGDGKKTGGEKALNPILAFPAHLGPNDMMFYTGNMFPKRYKNGAFVAFHGQSNELKKGYFVAFVPFVNGKSTGKWEIFADNFAGVDLVRPTGPIQHRPCGLAQGPKGELYVCDDLGGTVFRITYK